MSKTLTGNELIKALSENTLKEFIIKEGVIKQDENSPDSVLFSEGMEGHDWITIPAEAINEVEILSSISYNSHQSIFVRLYLNAPSKENKIAKMFASLVQTSTPNANLVSGGALERVRASTPNANLVSGSALERQPSIRFDVIRPNILAQKSGTSFIITGSGFTPQATIRIRAVDDYLHELDAFQSADNNGGLNYTWPSLCSGFGRIYFSATDGRPDPSDLTGVLWSNIVTSTCP